jgi:hypothetical protein
MFDVLLERAYNPKSPVPASNERKHNETKERRKSRVPCHEESSSSSFSFIFILEEKNTIQRGIPLHQPADQFVVHDIIPTNNSEREKKDRTNFGRTKKKRFRPHRQSDRP